MCRLTSVFIILFIVINQTACFGGKFPPVRDVGGSQTARDTQSASWKPVQREPVQKENDMLPPLPFSLHILDELYDGKRLYVQGRLDSETSWDMEDLAIRLVSLGQGEPIGVSEYALVDLIVDRAADAEVTDLSRSKPADFLVWAEAEGMTDYQLEVLWGDEASKSKRAIGRKEELNISQSRLEIRNIVVETEQLPCERGEICLANLLVSGELFNSGTTLVSFVNLAIGIGAGSLHTESNLSPAAIDTEEVVEITNIALTPGNSRELRLALERQVIDPGQRPYLRILSFGGPEGD